MLFRSWNLKKMMQINLFTKQKQTHRHRKQIYGYQRGKRGEICWPPGECVCVFVYVRAWCTCRMTVLLLVCLTQSWLLWKFIRFQLRRWREFRHEQAARKRAATKQPARPLKRDSRKHTHAQIGRASCRERVSSPV